MKANQESSRMNVSLQEIICLYEAIDYKSNHSHSVIREFKTKMNSSLSNEEKEKIIDDRVKQIDTFIETLKAMERNCQLPKPYKPKLFVCLDFLKDHKSDLIKIGLEKKNVEFVDLCEKKNVEFVDLCYSSSSNSQDLSDDSSSLNSSDLDPFYYNSQSQSEETNSYADFCHYSSGTSHNEDNLEKNENESENLLLETATFLTNDVLYGIESEDNENTNGMFDTQDKAMDETDANSQMNGELPVFETNDVLYGTQSEDNENPNGMFDTQEEPMYETDGNAQMNEQLPVFEAENLLNQTGEFFDEIRTETDHVTTATEDDQTNLFAPSNVNAEKPEVTVNEHFGENETETELVDLIDENDAKVQDGLRNLAQDLNKRKRELQDIPENVKRTKQNNEMEASTSQLKKKGIPKIFPHAKFNVLFNGRQLKPLKKSTKNQLYNDFKVKGDLKIGKDFRQIKANSRDCINFIETLQTFITNAELSFGVEFRFDRVIETQEDENQILNFLNFTPDQLFRNNKKEHFQPTFSYKLQVTLSQFREFVQKLS